MRMFACVLAVTLAIFCMNSPASAQSRVDFHLLPAVSTGPLDPDWSPDGRYLVYAAHGDLWKLPMDGGASVALTEGPAYYSEPAYSPDGNTIALTMDIDGDLEIGIVDVATGELQRLTNSPQPDFAAEWNPDGTSLFFVSRRFGDLDILRMELATGQVSKVVAGPGNEYQPKISPDGQSLAYVAPVENRNGSGGIWLLSLASDDRKLVHYEESSYRLKPEWSPDGKQLIYVSDAAGSPDLAIVPAQGGNRIRLTEDSMAEFDPAISPDGTRLAFVSNEAGPTQLFTMSAAGGERNSWSPVTAAERKRRFRTGFVTGRVLDANEQTVPARLMVSASDGRSYTEDGGFHRIVPATRTHYQHTNGEFRIEVPVGPLDLEAMRGFEFLPVRASVDIHDGETSEVVLRLRRIDDPASRGWYSGDMHVHDLHEGRFGMSHNAFFQQLVADDLRVTNALIHMDGSKIMGRWNDLTGAPNSLSTETHILRYSQEFRGAFGHIGLVGINQFIMPMIGGAPNTPFSADDLGIRHIDAAHEQGGIAGFVHPYNVPVSGPADAATAAIPVIAALGKGDFYDVASVASLELESAKIYYKLLNAGIHIAATGGTDNFSDVWFDPSGGATRTYAQTGEQKQLDHTSWLRAVEEGRTFASNGPLLFLSVDGVQPGEEISLSSDDPDVVEVVAKLASVTPVEKLEILLNGEVVAKWRPDGGGPNWQFETSVTVPAGGWIAARAIGPSSRYVGDAFAFAQTSPVYIKVDNQQFTSLADANYLLQSVDELWRRVETRDAWFDGEQKANYLHYVDQARSYYRDVMLLHPEDAYFAAKAPETFRVEFSTTKGTVLLELHRGWAPRGVDRFYNLVRSGYYDDSRFFRIRDGDFVQFGIHGKPAVAQSWRNQRIPDDPVRQSNKRGTVAFAMGTEPDDRTTQVYINLKDKPELDAMGFAIMGEVIKGMDVADALYSGYGETAAGGIRAGNQDVAFEGGNEFFSAQFPKLDSIIRATIVDEQND